MKNIILSLVAVMFIAGCATVPVEPRGTRKFNAARPVSILVVPVVNETMDVKAPDFFLTTVSQPIAEQGYYVFPVHMVKRVLEENGLYDANLVHNASAVKLASLFGADAVMYIIIKNWESHYAVLSTTVAVSLDYTIKDGYTGETLWHKVKSKTYSTNANSNSGNPLADLIAEAVVAACTKAFDDGHYVALATQTNNEVLSSTQTGLAYGPYLVNHNLKKAGKPPVNRRRKKRTYQLEETKTETKQETKPVKNAETAETKTEPAATQNAEQETVAKTSASETSENKEETAAA